MMFGGGVNFFALRDVVSQSSPSPTCISKPMSQKRVLKTRALLGAQPQNDAPERASAESVLGKERSDAP